MINGCNAIQSDHFYSSSIQSFSLDDGRLFCSFDLFPSFFVPFPKAQTAHHPEFMTNTSSPC